MNTNAQSPQRDDAATKQLPSSELLRTEELPAKTIRYCSRCRSIFAIMAPVNGRCLECNADLEETKYRFSLHDARAVLVGLSAVPILAALLIDLAIKTRHDHLLMYCAGPLVLVIMCYAAAWSWMSLGWMRGGLHGQIVRMKASRHISTTKLINLIAASSWIFTRLSCDPPLPWSPNSFRARLVSELLIIVKIAVVGAFLVGISALIQTCKGSH